MVYPTGVGDERPILLKSSDIPLLKGIDIGYRSFTRPNRDYVESTLLTNVIGRIEKEGAIIIALIEDIEKVT